MAVIHRSTSRWLFKILFCVSIVLIVAYVIGIDLARSYASASADIMQRIGMRR